MLVADGSGWCGVHHADATQYDRWRGSAADRGYDYRWQMFRAKLFREPEFVMCRDCLTEGVYAQANELHHIKKVRQYPTLMLRRENIMPLCKAHHAARSARGE
jgi:5-methylcytosine-specific restriction protein A